MAFQENLKKARISAGYVNAKDFAENVLGVSYPTYNKYETRGAWPKEETLKRIASALHVSIDSLLDHEPQEPNYLESAKGIAKMCGVKFHVPKDGFIQIDSIRRRKAPPNFLLPEGLFQCIVFKVCDGLKPELDTFRAQINEYKKDRFSEVFRHIVVNLYCSVAKETEGRASYVFDSPYFAEKFDKIKTVDEFIDQLLKP